MAGIVTEIGGEAATATGKPVPVCGVSAAEPRFACLLVGLGVRELSMNPVSASRVRFAIRATSHAGLKEIAGAALTSDSPQRVSALLDEALGQALGDILAGQAVRPCRGLTLA